jgi:pyruvate/2-oxoglutarate dehydrogenase complex dihydrolipoamide dehydrogenase (E3) component
MAQLDQYFLGYRRAEQDRLSRQTRILADGAQYPVRVAVMGGGIGGMALALSLHDAGFHDVDVYESASCVKELGSASTCSRTRHASSRSSACSMS